MSEYKLFTSESVSEGHPDKMADQISDGILDAIISQDQNGRVAVETMIKTGMVVVAGEVSSTASIELEQVVREIVTNIGYNNSSVGFDGDSCAVLNAIGKQSPDIAMGVDSKEDKEQGAGLDLEKLLRESLRRGNLDLDEEDLKKLGGMAELEKALREEQEEHQYLKATCASFFEEYQKDKKKW